MIDEFLAPLRLPQKALDSLDSLGDIAQDLGALREGVGSGLDTLDETTTSIHEDMAELSTRLEGLARMEETTASIHEDMAELSTQLEGLARMEKTTASIHGDMTELSTRLEGLARMEDALETGLTDLGARIKRLSKQLEILPTPRLAQGDAFPEFALDSPNGPVELRDRWRERPLAVAFLRHMGCAFCREHLAELDKAREEIHAAGGDVVAIFQNPGGEAREFCDERGIGLDCLGDPRRDGYDAVALKKGSWKEYLGPAVLMRQVQAARSGHKPGLPKGSVAQRPGTFVVGTDGLIVFAHYNIDSSDNPTTDAVLAAIREATGASTNGAVATPRSIAPLGVPRVDADGQTDGPSQGNGDGPSQGNGTASEAVTCRPEPGRRGRGKC